MEIEALLAQLADPLALPALAQSLADADTATLVDYLKAEADRHWWINANRSLELADLIVRIGQARGDACHTALGTMARGDALTLLGRADEAWATLGRAGELFQECGDQVGWARTRIGRLVVCVDLNRVAEALADAERARDILTRQAMHEKRLVLDLNTAVVYGLLGNQRQALAQFQLALATAEELGQAGQNWLGPVYTNIGLTYEALGELRHALTFHKRAATIFEALNETRNLAITETNIAIIAMKQGHYRSALSLLHRAHDLYIKEDLARDAAEANRAIVECYLMLNRYAEARDLARQVSGVFHTFGAAYQEAITLLHLASAEVELSNLDGAVAALDAAETIFASVQADAWVATTRLRRGRIALHQRDIEKAWLEADAAAAKFQANGQQVEYAAATLLRSEALLATKSFGSAIAGGLSALGIAQRSNVPALRYTAHLLLGRAAEAQGDGPRAARRYRAAAATVDRVQRGLTITLRPGFLEDKGQALQALLGLELRAGAPARAFETLERAKSQALLNYLANREQLRWATDDPHSRALIDELNQLREEHQWLYQLAHEQSAAAEAAPGALAPEQAQAAVAARERRMRAITEQLYLHSGERSAAANVAVPSLHDVQGSLPDNTLLIEFYNDGTTIWAFTVDTQTVSIDRLPATASATDQLLAQLQLNLGAALKAGPNSPATRGLSVLAQRLLQRLYANLLKPLEPRMRGRRRLVIVPYGSLHYLPFHLLHTGSAYLIEQNEVVILPAAGLATRRAPARPSGALVLAHSWEGRLPQTVAEARIVQQLFGGQVLYDRAASRLALRTTPAQILHIAAHGQHRLDQPELSYIQLADGQLYTDDLLQLDLSYELVTLSACETGRANLAAGDELIGLGRGMLYAGAGALVVSLWRVADATTVGLMEHMYHSLSAGASKAQALRTAQRVALDTEPQLHPAFWGPFQLVGDASPLSTYSTPPAEKEQLYVRLAATA